MSKGFSMATANKSELADRRQSTGEVLLKDWEQEFRTDFGRDGGARFYSLLERFGILTGAQDMLEGTVDFVAACATFKILDGAEISGFLADQRYDSAASTASYALTFDLYGRSSARLLVRPDMRSIDLADLYEYPWERLRMAGYGTFWISRIDGADLLVEEIEKLDQLVSADIWFDYSEDEISIIFDPDTYAGALSITVYEQSQDTPDTKAQAT